VSELERSQHELGLVLRSERLLDRQPVLQASIDRRGPFVAPLSFVQLELLRRLRANGAGGADGAGGAGEAGAVGGADGVPGAARVADQLGRISLLTINGIASGLRNTG
ncbi:MAG: phosphoenolpyruvate carboxylase, partial [Solirubrobacteraceae bacterium]|nr:phosphoenolpyruvate carboxylase [Solirubrobacteraceae bacterium]